jgi:DNA-binding MarR family transcriptional regulator
MTTIADFKSAARTHAETRTALHSVLRQLGYPDVSPERAAILAALAGGDRCVGDLSDTAYFGSNVSYNVGKLVSGGYATATPAAHDQRVKILSLTEKGRRLVDRVSTGGLEAA